MIFLWLRAILSHVATEANVCQQQTALFASAIPGGKVLLTRKINNYELRFHSVL